MYIQPNTTIHILKNIPLSRDYENTVYYPNAQQQADAFLKYNKYTLSQYSYQRAQLGSIRVQIKYENLYDCNYLMFKNTSFENKWFYAFIDSVAYVNDNVSEIYYSIDVPQTWAYNYHFLDSFVERRHSATDAMYENTQPEGLELGSEYEQVQSLVTELDSDPHYVIIATQLPSNSYPYVYYNNVDINGIYCGCYVMIHNAERTKATLQLYIDNGLEDSIIAFYTAPCGTTMQTKNVDFTFVNKLAGGYVPKNKKLYTFPFTKLQLTNRSGLSVDYQPEYFTDGKAQFKCVSAAYPQAISRMYPIDYTGGAEGYDNGLIYGAYPTNAFVGSAFAVYWAQNKNNYIATMNSILSGYDTNRAIAQNNYAMANRSADTSAAMSQNSIDASMTNAQGSADAAAQNYARSQGLAYGIKESPEWASFGLTGAQNARIRADQQRVQDANASNSAASQMAAATVSAAAQRGNIGMALDLARKSNANNFANSNLSNLTSKNNAIALLEAKKRDIKNIPNTAHGNAMCDGLNWAEHVAGFALLQESIKPEYAQIIDNYFTAYGYAQNKLMKGSELDNRINRPHYTYIRTVGANITGEMNQQDITVLRSIYDNGVTIWDTLEDVGNYDLDNQPK